MKTIIAIVVSLAIAAGAHAQQSAHRVKILKLEGVVQQTPEYQVSGPSVKTTKPRFWIEIEAEVEVETTDKSGFIPELRAEWFAVVMDKASGTPVRLLGEVSFKNIRTKDKKVYLNAYIEPDTLERLTGKEKPKESDIEGYALTLSGEGIVTNGNHAAGLTMATAEKHAKWWETWEGNNLEDLIVSKSRTPFAALSTDRYPTEKPGNP